MDADMAEGYGADGPRTNTVRFNRRRTLRRMWERTELHNKRLYSNQLLHKGGKP